MPGTNSDRAGPSRAPESGLLRYPEPAYPTRDCDPHVGLQCGGECAAFTADFGRPSPSAYSAVLGPCALASGAPIRQVLADNPRLEIMYFPVAAPDLNPQEWVWKQTRRAVSHDHLTPKLAQLADDFERCLKSHTFEHSFLERYGFALIYPILN